MEQIRQGREFEPSSFKDARSSVFKPAWLVAWYPGVYFALTVGASLYLFFENEYSEDRVWQLFLGAVVIYIACIWYVNRISRPILDAFADDARTNAQDIMSYSGDTESFTLRYRTGSIPLLRAPLMFEPTTLIVADSSAAVYDDVELNVRELDPHIGEDSIELFYDQIASVSYDSPNLEMNLTTGSTHRFPSTRKPDDVLHELQQRIREHKR